MKLTSENIQEWKEKLDTYFNAKLDNDEFINLSESYHDWDWLEHFEGEDYKDVADTEIDNMVDNFFGY